MSSQLEQTIYVNKKEAQSIVLNCVLRKNEEISVENRWSLPNGSVLPRDDSYELNSMRSRIRILDNSSLIIENVTPNDAGFYTCAPNAKIRELRFKLKVSGKLKKIQ